MIGAHWRSGWRSAYKLPLSFPGKPTACSTERDTEFESASTLHADRIRELQPTPDHVPGPIHRSSFVSSTTDR
jgi:hypothetical protein